MNKRFDSSLVGAIVIAVVASVFATALVPAASAAPERRHKHHLVRYDGPGSYGVTISQPEQAASKLPGSPAGFQRFVAARLQAMLAHSGGCPRKYASITVARVRTDGYARGDVNQCGGYAAIWKRTRGHWHQVIGSQDSWQCGQLRHYAIPASIVRPFNSCYEGNRTKQYHHR